MEEKKAKKISVSVILLILAIIALVVMGLFIYKLELQAEVDDLNNTVSDLQRKIDKISETLSTNNSNSIQENTTNSSTEISNSAVKENSKIASKSYKFKNAAKSKKVKATLKDAHGNAIKKVKVTLKIKGKVKGNKSYSLKTSNKGAVKFICRHDLIIQIIGRKRQITQIEFDS